MTPSTDLLTPNSMLGRDTDHLLEPAAPASAASVLGSTPPAAAPRTNNTLKLKDRAALMTWMETAENRKLVADDSDATAAAQATATLGFDVTPANIMSIRRVLGIEKTKPAAPPADLNLVTLHEKVQAIGIEVEKIKAGGTDDTIALLKNRVNWLIEVTANNFHILAGVRSPYWLDFHGAEIPAVHGLEVGLISAACQALLKAYPSAPFAASWYIDGATGHAVYSLRSRKDGPNVAEIAAAMAPGGGGHPNAAGFHTPIPIPFV